MSTTSFEPGTRFGRYVLQRPLGQGGMGAVYLAHDEVLDRPVALKFPFFDDGRDERVVKRFHREARAAAKLRHPNVCPVFDVGEIDGRHFLSMAYIEGQPLDAFVRDRRRLPQSVVAAILRKIALALQAAHDVSLLHRDLKPNNVIVEPGGEPVLMDFGLALPTTNSQSRITGAGGIVGTPAYMAPELFEVGHDASIRSDVYSLGIMLYELLTGRLPYTGSSLTAIVGQIVLANPTPPLEIRPDLDPQLMETSLKAMSRSPAERHETASALADELGRLLGRLPAHDRRGPGDESTGSRRRDEQTPSSTVAYPRSGTADDETELVDVDDEPPLSSARGILIAVFVMAIGGWGLLVATYLIGIASVVASGGATLRLHP